MGRAFAWFWNLAYSRTFGLLTAETIVILGVVAFSYRS